MTEQHRSKRELFIRPITKVEAETTAVLGITGGFLVTFETCNHTVWWPLKPSQYQIDGGAQCQACVYEDSVANMRQGRK